MSEVVQTGLVPVTERPWNAETPLEALRAERTPNRLFFVRNHFDMPEHGEGSPWRLAVGGAVDHPLSLSLEEIRELGARSVTTVMECAGNGRAFMEPAPGGTPWGLGAVASAEFTGAPLSGVLSAAGLSKGARAVVFVGADRGETRSGAVEPYARSLPPELAAGADVLLVWEMNGCPLTREHGSPLRLVVPGWYGMASVKWLREITVLERPFEGFFQTQDYVLRPRDGSETPITRMLPRAIILEPAEEASCKLGPVVVAGIAWSGAGPITSVEVRGNDSFSWSPAELGPSASAYAVRRWQWRFDPPAPGRYVLSVRATDSEGETQPDRARWNERGYCNNAIQAREIEVI